MSLSNGHQIAIKQLEKISGHENNALEIISIESDPNENRYLTIDVSISCEGIQISDDGMPLKQREDLLLFIPSNFPFSVPEAKFNHFDYASYPHVQWGSFICLYLSKDFEWNPDHGMFGFIERLGQWLIRAAKNELDQTGQALHPPSTYVGDTSIYSICCDLKFPKSNEEYNLSIAKLGIVNDTCFEVLSWNDMSPTKHNVNAAVIHINDRMPYEFPHYVLLLFIALKNKNVDFSDIFKHLKDVVSANSSSQPLFLFICSPMMGIRGSDAFKTHIACWEINSLAVNILRKINNYSEKKSRRAKVRIDNAIDNFFNWAKDAKTRWCTVYDNRPEISERRDNYTSLFSFRNKSICLFGCGALGAHVALMLARADIKRISLYDNKEVHPGILTRQPFNKKQCGENKAIALEEIIGNINPDISVTSNPKNLKTLLLSDKTDWLENIDLLIDCTASNFVHRLLEKFNKTTQLKIPVISMSINSLLNTGMLVCLGKNYSNSVYSAYRKLLIDALKSKETKKYSEQFLLPEKINSFQPIPGCSEPTFRGSASDVQLFSSHMLNIASAQFPFNSDECHGYFISHDGENSEVIRLSNSNDILVTDTISSYRVLLSHYAYYELREIIQKNRNKRKETGGLLFGYRSDALKILWIDFASPPPPDSKSSRSKFECGISGVKELSDKYKKQYFNQVICIGTWHTHPKTLPLPSQTDLLGVAKILLQKDYNREKTFLLIIQPKDNDEFVFGGYLFEKENDNPKIARIKCI